jgi:hypothetical protein
LARASPPALAIFARSCFRAAAIWAARSAIMDRCYILPSTVGNFCYFVP